MGVKNITVDLLRSLAKKIAPELYNGKEKGEGGVIGIIGGSVEYTGAPYFAAMSALKSGADLIYLITTESAAPTIKTYSPDLAVYPYLSPEGVAKIISLLPKMDVVVIGAGLGRRDETIKLIESIIKACKALGKPLVIDADGLYVVAKNPEIIKDYPKPGVIMTPNKREDNELKELVSKDYYNYWGENVSILVTGGIDRFYSSIDTYNWTSSDEGTGRRTAGQGDILAGNLGTVYSWAIKYNGYGDMYDRDRIAQSVAAYGSTRLTRLLNARAFSIYGRSLIPSNMLEQMHLLFSEVY